MFTLKDAEIIIKQMTHSPKTGKATVFPLQVNPKALAKDLNEGFKTYEDWKKGWNSISTKKQIAQRLEHAIKSANKTHESYEQVITDIHALLQIKPTKLLMNTEDMISETIVDLELITENLSLTLDKVLNDNHEALESRKRLAETDFVGRILPEIYNKNFGIPAKISRPSHGGEPTGPTIRFICACIEKTGLTYKPEAIKKAIDTCKKDKSL